MCGIAGILNNTLESIKQVEINQMINQIQHRGPDDQGSFIQNEIALGHVRLSIQDLTKNGHQPMLSSCGEYVIAFNGEIYNFETLKMQLHKLGFDFTSSSDTEVILNGYIAWGTKIFEKLNGIFAVAIWDTKIKSLIVARDRFGVKPLYFQNTSHGFFFASEVKSILVRSKDQRVVDPQAFHEFMFYGNGLKEKTLFKGIKNLTPGTFLEVKNNENPLQHYFWRPEDITESEVTFNEAINKTKGLLEKAVKNQLVGDVPVGVFLSGGIDSSCITAFASKHYTKKIKTFSAAFDFENGTNELDKAKSIADFYGTDHEEMFIKGENLPSVIERLVWHHDAPFSDAANIPLFLMAEQVKKTHKVILQGDGGDEIFAGYRRYQMLNELQKYKPMIAAGKLASVLPFDLPAKNRLERMSSALRQKDDGMRMALLLTVETIKNSPLAVLSDNVLDKLKHTNPFLEYINESHRFNEQDLVQKMLLTDTQIILPSIFLEKVDKSTMGQSIEVRVPLLDNDLTDFIIGLPSSYKVHKKEKKWLLRQALRGVVPNEILDAPKTGFGVPFENWLKGPLNSFMKDQLFSESMQDLNLFNEEKLNLIISQHEQGKINHGFLLWKLMNLSLWIKKYKVEI